MSLAPGWALTLWYFSSLVPRRSLLIRCPREVWERAGENLSVTSQLIVEYRNDRAENAWGLGWYFSKWAIVLDFCYCFMIGSDYDSIFVTSQSRRQNSNPFLFKNKSSSTGTLLNYFRSQVLISVSFLFKKGYFYLYCLESENTWSAVMYLNGRF